MKVDCRWMESNLEAFFSENLPPEEDRLAHSHVDGCEHCKVQVEQLRSIDPLIHRLFQQDFALAQAPKRRRSMIPATVFATAMAAVLLVVALRTPQPISSPPLPVPETATISPAPAPPTLPETVIVPKVTGAPVVDRSKPQPAAPVSADQPRQGTLNPAPSVSAPGENAPVFMVVDPAGYSRSLRDYHGFVLIFGLWSPQQPETAANMEKVYQAFSSNTKLRILGVTADRQPKPADATFPTARNQGSTLLGAAPSEILVVDGSGKVRMRRSLLKDSGELLSSIHTTLTQLGIR